MAQNKKKEQKKGKGMKDRMLGFPKEWTSFGGKQLLKNNQREKIRKSKIIEEEKEVSDKEKREKESNRPTSLLR